MFNPELAAFAWKHRDADPLQLALSGAKNPAVSLKAAAAQVSALQKIKHKVPSWYKEGLDFPNMLSVEQASSEATARYKSSLFSGQCFIDLTGGLGVDAFFLAQNFSKGIYIEKQSDLAESVRHNFAVLGLQHIDIRCGDSAAFLPGLKADLIYLDPARRDDRKGRVFLLEDCLPNILALQDQIFEQCPLIALKTSPLLDIQQAIRQLGTVREVHIIASAGECKEVLYLLAAGYQGPAKILAVNLKTDRDAQVFEFSFEEERRTEVAYSAPLRYLYEPNPAILKAGAFKLFGARFGLSKLHPNTHLYTSDQLVEGAPARIFSIEAVCKYDKKSVQAQLPEARAHVSVRNFPEGAELVRKKLGLADGGVYHLFATTMQENRRVILICRGV